MALSSFRRKLTSAAMGWDSPNQERLFGQVHAVRSRSDVFIIEPLLRIHTEVAVRHDANTSYAAHTSNHIKYGQTAN